jgi:hypothetical protein
MHRIYARRPILYLRQSQALRRSQVGDLATSYPGLEMDAGVGG